MRNFEEFWQSYPRKVGKLAAKREWDRMRPTPDVITQISAALLWQCETWDDPLFIPHPKTWLHQGRWMDERPQERRSVASVWVCSHLEPCSHQGMCENKQILGTAKYPVKAVAS